MYIVVRGWGLNSISSTPPCTFIYNIISIRIHNHFPIFYRYKAISFRFLFYFFFSLQLPYVLSIEYDIHQGALLPPQLNIPAKGFVPAKVETFTVHLPCAGNMSVEVPIAINLFVQGPPRRNDTRLNFKRNKICLKGTFFSNPHLQIIYANLHTYSPNTYYHTHYSILISHNL